MRFGTGRTNAHKPKATNHWWAKARLKQPARNVVAADTAWKRWVNFMRELDWRAEFNDYELPAVTAAGGPLKTTSPRRVLHLPIGRIYNRI